MVNLVYNFHVMSNTKILNKLKNQIIVSVQSSYLEPLYDENVMIAMIKSVMSGGACGLRLAGERDIENARAIFPETPIIGITKPKIIPKNFEELVYITPTMADAGAVIQAGADIVAFDGTMRKRPSNEKLSDIVDFIHKKNRLAMADISTFDEARNAVKLGCDIISTTLSGYTKESIEINTQLDKNPEEPDFRLLEVIVNDKECNVPVILEGRLWEPSQVAKAFELGAFSVVIGSAITRPHEIVKRFIKKGLKHS